MVTNFAGEPLDSHQDLLGIAVRGMAYAVALGTLIVALVLWGVQRLLAGAPASDVPAGGPAPLLLLVGTLAALFASAVAAYRRLAPLGSSYRRGALAIVSAFVTFVAGLLAAPLHYFLGSPALLGLAGLAGLVALLLRRQVTR